MLCSYLVNFATTSSLAPTAAARRWPSTTRNDGQRHGGAAETNKSTGAPWWAPHNKHPEQIRHVALDNTASSLTRPRTTDMTIR